jgi:hypothetical protein
MVELTGSLGRVAELRIGYSFFQRSGTLGGHLVTENGDLGARKTHFAGLMIILYL